MSILIRLRSLYFTTLYILSRAKLLIRLQLELVHMQAFQDVLPILCQIWLSNWCCCACEEPRLPFDIPGLAIRRLLALSLFQLLLQLRSEVVLFTQNRLSNARPEFARLVGKLIIDRWYEFGNGEQWVEIYKEDFLLESNWKLDLSIRTIHVTVGLTVDLANGWLPSVQ